MVYTELTTLAMKLAFDAHYGQVDKAGVPYIFHPIHLAEQMTDEYSTCVALLHDVVEDTEVTLGELRKTFPEEVVEAIDLLTHRKEDEYKDYILRIKNNPIAMKVKLADIEHNSNQDRLRGAKIKPEKVAKLEQKYKMAKELLAK